MSLEPYLQWVVGSKAKKPATKLVHRGNVLVAILGSIPPLRTLQTQRCLCQTGRKLIAN